MASKAVRNARVPKSNRGIDPPFRYNWETQLERECLTVTELVHRGTWEVKVEHALC